MSPDISHEPFIKDSTIPVCETIEKRREPMPAMEAIYLIGSSDASVKCLLQDFSSQNRTTYKFAHVYFTEGKKEPPKTFISQRMIFSLSG